MTRKVIVNADDYGLTDGICSSINELVERTAISNTTLMICANGAPDRITDFLTNKTRTIAGVHLQLTGGKPVTSGVVIPSLIDENGSFKDPRQHSFNTKHVEIEWRSQIELSIKLLGKTPTHIDTHHGVHRIPLLFPVYTSLASSYGIPFRGSNDFHRELIREKNLAGTRALVRNWTGSCSGVDALIHEINEVETAYPDSNEIEVVSHPGFPDKYLHSISSLNSARKSDFETLCKISEQNIFSKNSIELVTFSSLLSNA